VWETYLSLELVLMMITEDTKVLITPNFRNPTLEVWSNYEDSVIFKDIPTTTRVNITNKPLLNF
jgi:hypothetical protein